MAMQLDCLSGRQLIEASIFVRNELLAAGYHAPVDLQVRTITRDFDGGQVFYIGIGHSEQPHRFVVGVRMAEQIASHFVLAKAAPDLKVVPIRAAPALTDIANQMRQLADKIEAGDVDAEACFCIVVHPDQFSPSFYAWGHVPDRHGIAGVFTHVAQLALTDKQK